MRPDALIPYLAIPDPTLRPRWWRVTGWRLTDHRATKRYEMRWSAYLPLEAVQTTVHHWQMSAVVSGLDTEDLHWTVQPHDGDA